MLDEKEDEGTGRPWWRSNYRASDDRRDEPSTARDVAGDGFNKKIREICAIS